jgi:nucleoside 2-deoxyribosyltransferase
MTRYFFEAYRRPPLGDHYFNHLAFDTLAFTVEALSFFVMSRSLSPGRAQTFALAALVVFVTDFVWVLKCKFFGLPSRVQLDTWWIVQDPVAASLLGLSLLAHRLSNRCTDKCLHITVCFILLLEAAVDLPVNWRFYFPAARNSSEAVANMDKTKVYFAGPLFTQAEWRWNARLIEALRKEGYEVIAPQEEATGMLEGRTSFDPHALFQANVDGIKRCNVVVAVLDGADADSGTAWECGYAHREGRPVVALRTDLRAGGDDPKAAVNLMMSQSWKELVTLPLSKRDDEAWIVQKLVEAIKRAIG